MNHELANQGIPQLENILQHFMFIGLDKAAIMGMIHEFTKFVLVGK